MGLHIYSGSLVRFFTNDWENEIARYSREHGLEYQADWPDGQPEWPSARKAADRLKRMRRDLLKEMKLKSNEPLWNDAERAYRTHKLHAEGREALTLVAAHLHRTDLPMPRRMPATPHDDQAYSEAQERGYLLGPIAAFECSLIVPGQFDRLTFVETPVGERVLTCSTTFLRQALEFVQDGYWSGKTLPEAWLERGLGYARGSGVADATTGQLVLDEEPEDSLRLNVEFAFGVYSSALSFSDTHRTAIALW